jgi:hypothetical protein
MYRVLHMPQELDNSWLKDFQEKRIGHRFKILKMDEARELHDFPDRETEREEFLEYKRSLLRGAHPIDDPDDPMVM